MSTPYIGFGNDQLAEAPALADVIQCDRCGSEHQVQTSRSTDADGAPGRISLAFYKCGGSTYLAGLNGKDVRGTKPACKGSI